MNENLEPYISQEAKDLLKNMLCVSTEKRYNI